MCMRRRYGQQNTSRGLEEDGDGSTETKLNMEKRSAFTGSERQGVSRQVMVFNCNYVGGLGK